MATKVLDNIEEKALWTITKYADDSAYKAGNPFAVEEVNGNVLLNEGINELWTLLCSSGGTKFDNSNAFLAVGDSTTSADATQSGLLGSNKFYKAVDSGSPSFGTQQKATWVATFTGSEANFQWREFSVSNGGSDSNVNLNRKVSDQGTKVTDQVWELTLEITLQ